MGPWLPEPIVTTPDVAERAELSDSVELRCAGDGWRGCRRSSGRCFVLREAFDLPFSEIAEVIRRSEAATRQLPGAPGSTCRRPAQVRRRQGCGAEGDHRTVHTRRDERGSRGPHGAAVRRRDAGRGDGGGKAGAPPQGAGGPGEGRPLLTSAASPSDIHKFHGLDRRGGYAELTSRWPPSTAGPAAVISTAGRVVTVISLVVVDGRIDTIYLIANPEKMAHLHQAS
ncbi:RNA polymerase subunit sigma-24 [Nonomuraea dietziae]|uniref:RNA polymerase subunit sigma-24 n=1 Tax=Nonomuraea dietziae TaxID=65515 RepID=UPI0031D7EC8D